MLIKRIFTKTSQASVLLPVIAGFASYKALTRPFKTLLYFFVICVGFECYASISIEFRPNNMAGQHLYTLVEFLAFSLFFYQYMPNGHLLRRLVLVNMFVFAGIAIFDGLYLHGLKVPNDFARTYSSIFITLYTLIVLYSLFQKEDILYVWQYPVFWICTGALIYFAGVTLYAMLKSYLLEYRKEIERVSNLVHAGLNIVANCLYAQSFRCLGRQKRAL